MELKVAEGMRTVYEEERSSEDENNDDSPVVSKTIKEIDGKSPSEVVKGEGQVKGGKASNVEKHGHKKKRYTARKSTGGALLFKPKEIIANDEQHIELPDLNTESNQITKNVPLKKKNISFAFSSTPIVQELQNAPESTVGDNRIEDDFYDETADDFYDNDDDGDDYLEQPALLNYENLSEKIYEPPIVVWDEENECSADQQPRKVERTRGESETRDNMSDNTAFEERRSGLRSTYARKAARDDSETDVSIDFIIRHIAM